MSKIDVDLEELINVVGKFSNDFFENMPSKTEFLNEWETLECINSIYGLSDSISNSCKKIKTALSTFANSISESEDETYVKSLEIELSKIFIPETREQANISLKTASEEANSFLNDTETSKVSIPETSKQANVSFDTAMDGSRINETK